MKRTTCFLLALLMLLLAACGSGKETSSDPPAPEATPTPVVTPSTQPTPEPTPGATPEPAPTSEPGTGFTHPLTGLPTETDLSGQKPVAIMLNNLKQALPQQGNSQADIIYEVLAEGGITRMLALYQDPSVLGTVGSVRSARLYYFELALGHDAVFIHAGGSPEFYTVQKKLGITTVDGVVGYYGYASTGLFWRDSNRIPGKDFAYEHSLLTSGQRITDILTKQGLLGEHLEGYTSHLKFSDSGTNVPMGTAHTTVTVPFSNYKTGVFRYDASTGLYAVEEYGQPYIDGNDGSQVAVTNLLVLFADTEVMDSEGRLSIDLSSGGGWYACGGELGAITWSKGGVGRPLRFLNEDGDDIILSPGKTYICIVPTSRVISADGTELPLN